jgi:hypothetical protein
MENIIKMEDPASVRSVANRLDQLGDSLLEAQTEIGGAARGMDWDGSAKDNFIQDVDAWGGKMRSLSTRCDEKSIVVLKEVDEWENAAKGFVEGYTPFIKGENDSSAADESDIHQGDIGDCFLMSSMGAIALTHPEILEDMIEVLPDGRYKVRFYDKKCVTIFGPCHYEPHYVIVDGEFEGKLSDPMDSTGGTRESWTMILEKAYMQWQKENNLPIDLPSPAVAMSAMTGKDCANYCMPQISMGDLTEAFRRGDAITAGSRWPTDQTRPHEYFDESLPDNAQIAEGHVYFVTGVDPVNNTVTVQNPWGPDCPPITMPFEDYQKCFWLTTTNPVV